MNVMHAVVTIGLSTTIYACHLHAMNVRLSMKVINEAMPPESQHRMVCVEPCPHIVDPDVWVATVSTAI